MAEVFTPSPADGLKDVTQAASPGKFKARLAFLQNLDALGPTEKWLEAIPPGKIAHFAGEARVTDDGASVPEAARTLKIGRSTAYAALARR
ncbi:hypothetical protein AB0J63_00910 [Streptosporangium canum]|uniref:hypothetical protein n=1 Tax=Streptosporangium canum TaxID=324952 RepID=UPI003424AAD1